MNTWKLNCSEARAIISAKKEILKDISTGKHHCDRHNRWIKASCRTRSAMQLQSHQVDCLQEPVRNSVIHYLLEEMKEVPGGPRGTEWFAYTWDVLFPEAAIILLMTCDEMSYESALEAMFKFPPGIGDTMQPTISSDSEDSSEGDGMRSESGSTSEAKGPPGSGVSLSRSTSNAAQLLARGASIQRATRGRLIFSSDGCSSKQVAIKSSYMLRMMPMRRTRLGTYRKNGAPQEVSVPYDSTYLLVARLGGERLGLRLDEGSKWCLFHPDGTIIPNESIGQKAWTLGKYLGVMKTTQSQSKFGVGVIDEDTEEMPPAKRRKKTEDEAVVHSVKVLYVANLGRNGLDTEYPMTRVKVYSECGCTDPPLALFHPESLAYSVYSITVGEETILSVDHSGVFSVLNDERADTLRIVHQSEVSIVKERDVSIPIYCVGSGHTLDMIYTWKKGDTIIGRNSPVLWVSDPGLYSCRIMHNFQQCSSLLINVTGSAMTFSEHDVEKMSENFSEEKLIGKGGFGKVYKGKFRHTDVAVKVLSKHGVNVLVSGHTSISSNESDVPSLEALLATEIAALTRFRHPNLLGLMGYCCKPPALIYPYMSNGSLFDALHKYKITVGLPLLKRFAILHDVCCGLAYLHGESPPVIHHDINTSNILLDKNFAGKLSDFGFSVQLPRTYGGKTVITAKTGLAGTNGYRPPEYAYSKFSLRSDIFSFGVVILECYTGQLAFSDSRDANNLVDFTEEDRKEVDTFMKLVDEKAGNVSRDVSINVLKLINKMVKNVPSYRPAIDVVLDDVKFIFNLMDD